MELEVQSGAKEHAMTEASPSSFKQCSNLLVPEALRIHFKATELECWLSAESPIVGLAHSNPEARSPWLENETPGISDRKGAYIWLYQSPDNTNHFRFLHVGESGKGVGKRNQEHAKNAFTTDKVPTFSATPGDGGYQRMKIVCSDKKNRCKFSKQATHTFLANVRVLYVLLPECLPEDQCKDAAAYLEGSIDKIAALGGWRESQTTNDRGTSAPTGVANDAFLALRSALNKVLPMFPPPGPEDLWTQWELDHTAHWSCSKNGCFYKCSNR